MLLDDPPEEDDEALPPELAAPVVLLEPVLEVLVEAAPEDLLPELSDDEPD